ncbi:MAG: tetratricopeptide repeat protein [Spirochaetaceae bacterium]|jgi:tetratricopeptide (TPR) repeat protein|nr:tetratricopeptide repeat protein [Spirochaetaceae bacterium]
MKPSCFFLTAAFLFVSTALFAQETRMSRVITRTPAGVNTVEDRIDAGIELFEQGRWAESIQELRIAQREAVAPVDKSEILFWMAIAEIANGDYENAIVDLNDIRRVDPSSVRILEIPYQKGRALFGLKRYNEAVNFFQEYDKSIRIDGRYINSIRFNAYPADTTYDSFQIEYNKKAAALFWIGECYYFMEDYERALGYYSTIVEQYMKSYKYENSMHRIDLIKQKKLNIDLSEEIKVLQKPPEDPQMEVYTGGPSYDEAILAYQSRIAPYLMLRALGEEQKVRPQEQEPTQSVTTVPMSVPIQPVEQDYDVIKRLLAIKNSAVSLKDKLISLLNAYDMIEIQRW